MQIWVCSLAAAPDLVRACSPERVVSLLSPYDDFPDFALAAGRHLRLAVHDIVEDAGDWKAPGVKDVEDLLAFLEGWDRTRPLLAHCWAGISRSSATAYIAALLHEPFRDETELALALREASPTASPNLRMIACADALLGRGGRMTAAVSELARTRLTGLARPFRLDLSGGAAQ